MLGPGGDTSMRRVAPERLDLFADGRKLRQRTSSRKRAPSALKSAGDRDRPLPHQLAPRAGRSPGRVRERRAVASAGRCSSPLLSSTAGPTSAASSRLSRRRASSDGAPCAQQLLHTHRRRPAGRRSRADRRSPRSPCGRSWPAKSGGYPPRGSGHQAAPGSVCRRRAQLHVR